MNSRCNDTQEVLVESSGNREGLDIELLTHLDQCGDCQAVAEGERTLSKMLEDCEPDADLETAVQALIARSRIWRRVKGAVPVLASMVVLLTGVGFLGGVPGGSLVSLVPHWSAQGWTVLLEAMGGLMLVLSAGAQVASAQLTASALLGFGVVGLIGVSLVVFVARRWVHRRAWQRGI